MGAESGPALPAHRGVSILMSSRSARPETQEGDRQVPEGCTRSIASIPLSDFHLSWA